MLSAGELRERAKALRRRNKNLDSDRTWDRDADLELVREVEGDVAEYRTYWATQRSQLPPDDLADRLHPMGWVMYELTWGAMQFVAPSFESIADERHEISMAALDLIARVADAARAQPWPEFAPRALGAIRAQALAESKRDTERGYEDAWHYHEQADMRHESFMAMHAGQESRKELIRHLDEVSLQLALARTGTACRTAERIIGRWAEGLISDPPLWIDDEEDSWTELLFDRLRQGVTIGERALAVAQRVEDEHGFVDDVTEERMALRASYQNPGIMTCRAALLLLALTPEMDRLGHRPVDGHRSWSEFRQALLQRFKDAYRKIERPVTAKDGTVSPMKQEYARSLAQLRLNLALLAPGYPLRAGLVVAPCFAVNPLGDEAVEQLSGWLAEIVGGRQRGDANVIGSATKPSFLAGVEFCREELGGRDSGYRGWRRRWIELDRYIGEPDRRELALRVLGTAP
jgi:hypothetical protein